MTVDYRQSGYTSRVIWVTVTVVTRRQGALERADKDDRKPIAFAAPLAAILALAALSSALARLAATAAAATTTAAAAAAAAPPALVAAATASAVPVCHLLA